MALRKDTYVAAVMSVAGTKEFSPGHIQKIFFILDRELDVQYFDFKPDAYGPYDGDVYGAARRLEEKGLATVRKEAEYEYHMFRLTDDGVSKGKKAFGRLPKKVRTFIEGVVVWALSLTFHELVAAVFNEYPDMKENAVFKDWEESSANV